MRAHRPRAAGPLRARPRGGVRRDQAGAGGVEEQAGPDAPVAEPVHVGHQDLRPLHPFRLRLSLD